MNKAIFAAAAATCLALCACNNNSTATQSEDMGDLAGARIGAPFTLTDQNGKQVSWDSFKGKFRLVYFGYTYCPDVCPVDLQKIMAAYTRFETQSPQRAAKLQPIFISVDPDRDTPAVLKPYVAAFSPRLIGLTGTDEQIEKVARDFVVVYGKDREGATKDYLVNHSRTPYLFDQQGKPLALVPVDDPATTKVDESSPDAILKSFEYWIK